MQKKLIALAIAGLSSAAFAQSNVTIYGVVDLGMESVSVGNQAANLGNKSRVISNSSHIGFKGEEDLGNGLKAVFQIEQALSMGVNADSLAGTSNGTVSTSVLTGNARDSFVGVTGAFGSVKIGTLTGIYRANGNSLSFSPGASAVAYTGAIYGTINGVKTGTDDRTANAVMYTSPAVNGFTANLLYSAGGNRNLDGATTSVNGKSWELGLNYAIGGLTLGYAHANKTDLQMNSTTYGLAAAAAPYSDELKGNRLTAKYALGQGTTLVALWDKQDYQNDQLNNSVERSAWMIGAGHQFGQSQAFIEYGRANKRDLGTTGNVADSEARQLTLGFNHDLSKRTKLRAYWSRIDNKSASMLNFYNNGLAAGSVTAGGDPRALGASVRHAF